jgi:hypothetical protein
MRKSERIRLLEMQLLRLEFQMESLNGIIQVLLDMNNLAKPELDAGKWYQRKIDGNR